MESITVYHGALLAMGVAGGLLFLQLLVADIAGMKVKRIPGAPIEPDHDSLLFRASRALGNMNESVSIFIIFTLVGILSAAEPSWLGRLAWVYVISRAAYMLCYCFNVKLMRSVFFAFSFLALLGLGIVMAGGLMG